MNMFVGFCLFVSVYDRYHVFMGLIFWVWEIGTNYLFFFFFDKVTHVFLWRRKERKKNEEEEKKMAIGASLWRRKHEIQKNRWVKWVYEEEMREK